MAMSKIHMAKDGNDILAWVENNYSCEFCSVDNVKCFVSNADSWGICVNCVKQLYKLNKEKLALEDLMS